MRLLQCAWGEGGVEFDKALELQLATILIINITFVKFMLLSIYDHFKLAAVDIEAQGKCTLIKINYHDNNYG